MPTYSRPGVYVEEIPSLPPSVIPIETAIPVFIGYTNIIATALLHLAPQKVFSMREYESLFGKADPETTSITVSVNLDEEGELPSENVVATLAEASRKPHIMYYALQAYFLNGGGPCWIISVGPYNEAVALGDSTGPGLQAGLNQAEFVDEATILVFPEAMYLSNGDRKTLYDSALLQCEKKKNRFLLTDATIRSGQDIRAIANSYRDSMVGFNHLKYGAAYAPNLETVLNFEKTDASIVVTITHLGLQVQNANLEQIKNGFSYSYTVGAVNKQVALGTALYNQINAKIADLPLILPPSPIMAGIYVQVDQTRGVFKAPANVSVNGVTAATIRISDAEHDGLNIHPSGKSINAIRSFAGRGILVFGARTLAGNDKEWRYISVRRFFNFAEVSIKNTIIQFLFEPNDKNTWGRVKAMISNFLTIQWQQGALTGNNPQQAFFVNVGLGSTMTAIDILEGRLNVEVGMVVVRPAEFIILRFSHLMQVS